MINKTKGIKYIPSKLVEGKELILLFLKKFYWSMITLQCVSLHCTTKLISHTHTDIPCFLDFPPI